MADRQQAQFLKTWGILVFFYVVSTSFLSLFYFPIVQLKAQLPELILLGMFGFLALNFKKISWQNFRWTKLDYCLLALPIIVFFTSFFASDYGSFFEAFGLTYLFSIYLTIKLLLVNYAEKSTLFLFYSFLFLGLLAAVFALLGMLLYLLEIPTSLVWIYEHFPYFGHSARVQGFALRPTMLANILSISMLFLASKMWLQGGQKLSYWIAFLLMLLAAVLTLSKGILLFIVGLLFVLSKTSNLSSFTRRITQLGMFLCAFAYLFGTHFLVVDKAHPQLEAIQAASFNVGDPIADTETKLIIPTAYTALKQASLKMGSQHWLIGIGAGNHNQYVGQLKQKGDFPNQIPNLDPHSTYFGGFAELGILGLLAILCIVFIVGKSCVQLLKQSPKDYFTIALISCFLMMGLEAIATDILNFRHLWVLFAALGFLTYRQGNQSGLPAGMN
ncbi:MAG: O-antigen ligase family protein [Bacteroidota bacterium]